MEVAILVPYRADNDEHRARAWRFVRERLEGEYPWPIHVGSCQGEWSKGAAVRDALAGTDADVLVIHDADSFLTPRGVLHDAVERVATDQWMSPHQWVYRQNEAATEAIYDGAEPSRRATDLLRNRRYNGVPTGGVLVITRAAWEASGGFDPRFVGWGGEDVSLGVVLARMGWPRRWIKGCELWHLYHPPAAPRGTLNAPRGTVAAEALVKRYRTAKGDDLAALIAEHRAEVTT